MANASTIINDEMTLEEKLAAIEQAMANAQQQAADDAQASGTSAVPVDPYDSLMCDSCQ